MSRHTVGISLNDDEYAQLKELAEEQDRYISGQARHMLREMLKIYAEAQIPLAGTHMAGAGSAPEAPDIRKFTGVVVPDEALVTGDDIRDNTSKQEPLPG